MQSVILSRDQIADLIPHQGIMCLLEGVQSWDQTQIFCAVTSHQDPANPLREGTRLHAVCGIEYAAQAIAVHRALLGTEFNGRAIGVIGGMRNVLLAVDRLDDIAEMLTVRAEKLLEQGGSLMYRFAIHAGDRVLISGRASVMMMNETAGRDRAPGVVQGNVP